MDLSPIGISEVEQLIRVIHHRIAHKLNQLRVITPGGTLFHVTRSVLRDTFGPKSHGDREVDGKESSSGKKYDHTFKGWGLIT